MSFELIANWWRDLPNLVFLPVIVGLLVALLKALGVHLIRSVAKALRAVWDFLLAIPKYLRLIWWVREERPLWEFKKFGKVDTTPLPPVITVMNFKGGVGKTTIAANIAASLSIKHNKKVLLIDLDYQGSLSSELLPAGENLSEKLNTTGDWLKAKNGLKIPEEAYVTPDGLPNVRLLTADYPLTEIEDNQFLRWLLQDVTHGDVRSRFVRGLKLTRQYSEFKFDYVVLDAPPRLSLSSANAIRASRMIIIPTKLEYLAVQPVERMLDRLTRYKKKSGGQFEIGGVVLNMTTNAISISARESEHVATLESVLDAHPDKPSIFDTKVPDSPLIGQSNSRPAYLSKERGVNTPAPIFDRLTDEILAKLDAQDSKGK
jgi:cellulose biosynthesis protein BcsQ